MTSLRSIFQLTFGCHHRQRSGVFTIKKRTYQVCLNCGQEFEYSWALMHAIRSSVVDSPHVPPNNGRSDDAAGELIRSRQASQP
jgi:hypothetical protein